MKLQAIILFAFTVFLTVIVMPVLAIWHFIDRTWEARAAFALMWCDIKGDICATRDIWAEAWQGVQSQQEERI